MNTNIENIEKGLAGVRKALLSYQPSEVDQQQAILLSIKALSDCKPNPFWLKGCCGRMLYLNPAYTKEFGVSAEAYLGDKDEFQWDKPTADSFKENDEEVIREGKAMKFIEEIPLEGEIHRYRIWKCPVYINGQVRGVAGESLGRYDG